MEEIDLKGFYVFDGKCYEICNGVVFERNGTGYYLKEDILPSSIQMYGKSLEAGVFELKVTEIKKIDNNQALIYAEDGAGIEFVFVEKDYSKNKYKYAIGKKGIYQIAAELESVDVPEDFDEGVTLKGADARKFFDWVEDEVEEDAQACVGSEDIGVYHPCEDFELTGRYNFYGIASMTGCLSVSDEICEPDVEKNTGFRIALMNQFDKEEPRFVDAFYKDLDYHEGEIGEGWAVKAVLRLICLNGTSTNLYEYGNNRTVTPEKKGLLGRTEEEIEEEE